MLFLKKTYFISSMAMKFKQTSVFNLELTVLGFLSTSRPTANEKVGAQIEMSKKNYKNTKKKIDS